MSEVKVNKISPRTGTDIELNSTAKITNFTSTGIDDNATSTAITIDSSQRVAITEQINKNVNNSQLIIAGGNDSNQGGNILLYGPSASPANTIVYRQGTTEILRMDSAGLKIGGTGSANALDDYEEGTFTPTWVGTASNPTVTYTQQNGNYTKVGNMVYARLEVATATTPSGGSGDLCIAGLPFTPTNFQQPVCSFAYVNNVTAQTNQSDFTGDTNGSNTFIQVSYHEFSGLTSYARVPVTAIHNTGPRMTVSIVYQAQ